MLKDLGILVFSALIAGCASLPSPLPGRDHPANPDAAEAPLPPASSALATTSAAPPATAESMEHEHHHVGGHDGHAH
jgi:hypothetical protein